MKKIYFALATLLITALSFGQTAGDIIITEIMQNPAVVSDANGEYFEVYNKTDADIDMNGWVISDADSDSFTVGSSVIVPSLGYAVFGKNGDAGTNGGVTVNYVFGLSFTLGNSGDEVILTSGATEIDRVEYTGGAPWPDPNGASMELSLSAYSLDNNVGANWGNATTSYGAGDLGTPGIQNVLPIERNQIEGFSMYPNPVVDGRVTINTMSNGLKDVQIFDMLGKQVLSANMEQNGVLKIASLTTGMYILKVEEEGKVSTNRLLIE